MTFLYGTNMELLYSMPAVGATQSGSAITLLNTAATCPPFQLPALQNIWSLSGMTGKGLMIVAAGGYDIAAANTLTTLKLSFDTVITTSLNTMASSAAIVPPGTTTTGAWQAQVWITCTGIASETASTWESIGDGIIGPSTGAAFMWNSAVVAGIPTPVTLATQTPFYTDLYAQWQVNPTAMVCTQFMVFGLN
jgi:hypothetical protein